MADSRELVPPDERRKQSGGTSSCESAFAFPFHPGAAPSGRTEP
jgi:hypothetical protein